MAYIDRSSNTRRTATAIAVAVIQAGAIYAVVTGLAVQFVKPPEKDQPLIATTVTPIHPDKPKEEPKPPVAQPARTLDRPQVAAVKTPFVEPQRTVETKADVLPGNLGTGGGDTVALVDPPKPPPPMATPHMARPRNAPGTWATTNDYPARDLREGNQGVTGFRLSIGADGKVLGCQVTASSGSSSLDQTACDKITRRARFEPATDGYGNTVPGTYASSVHWQIPD